MPTDHRAELAKIKRFDQLIAYLRDEMEWPISRDSFEDVDNLFYDFTADELGIDPKTAAKIESIKRLRPLSPRQPWGIFFVKFEPKRLPVMALRRILSQVALKKRASANKSERTAWAADDLLFVSNYGEGDERQISFAHFSQSDSRHDLPTLKVLGWDNLDTALHLDAVAQGLTQHLAWPDDDSDVAAWRERWRAAFTLRHLEVITTSKQLSIRLAELARAIHDRIKTALSIETERGPLTKLMNAFQEALIHDLDADGFADMYAQTIAYGLLSARIADPQKKTADDFAAHMRTSPFLRELMETFLKVGGRRGKAGGPGIDFDELGVSEVVELLDHANMEAVVRDFGDKNRLDDPVIHFYELFLHAYNKQLKIQRGVFYTPQPVVSYIVRSVNELLQTEFGLADGLADTATWGEMLKKHPGLILPTLTDDVGREYPLSPDEPFVQILDPATGTATFLVEVIDVIHRTLAAKWKQQRLTDAQQLAAWNDYVPQHLLPRLHAFELMMAPYAIAHMKIGLKLAETGYRFGTEERARIYLTNALEPWVKQLPLIGFDALAHEAAAVNEIKRHKRFTVVIGNPPYAGNSSNRGEWIESLINDYRKVNGQPLGEVKVWLKDDYVKFTRFSERLLDATRVGVLGFITNNSFFDGLTFRGMRHHLLSNSACGYFLNLHGNGNLKERAPDGSLDENVFDILQGVGVTLLIKHVSKPASPAAFSADLFGTREVKYKRLLTAPFSKDDYVATNPRTPNYFVAPQNEEGRTEYEHFVRVPDLFEIGGLGFQSHRDNFVVAHSAEEITTRMKEFFDLKLSDKEVKERFEIDDYRRFVVTQYRRQSKFDKAFVHRLQYRPFDYRHIYYARDIVQEWQIRFHGHLLKPNLGLNVMRQTKAPEWRHVMVSSTPTPAVFVEIKDGSSQFPLWHYTEREDSLFAAKDGRVPNLNQRLVDEWFTRLCIFASWIHSSSKAAKTATPEDIFHYAYAVFHSPDYRSRYAEFLKIDFPRLPLTGNLELFRALARLGGELTALHLLESPKLAQPITEFIGGRHPEVEKISWSRNTVWVDKAQTTGFQGVREDVWNFHIGGYQVCEKWLKDRKGRTLLKDDIAHYQKIVVALSETIRLMKDIDEIIEKHGGWPGAFQTGEAKAALANVIPFRPRTVEPTPEERYKTCVPLVPLKAAAGAFSEPQHLDDEGFEWVAVESRHRLRPGMFVAQVVGKSMEPVIPDGAYCLFRAPVEGTRQGKTVLVQLRDASDPETGQRYTVKRYDSEKVQDGSSWHHAKITLKPINPNFAPIVLTSADDGQLKVVAEFIEVLEGQV